MCSRQCPGAQPAIGGQAVNVPSLDDRADLDIAQLAKIVVSAILPGRPAEEHVACRLHQALPGNHPLAVVGMQARACIRFEHRFPRLFYL